MFIRDRVGVAHRAQCRRRVFGGGNEVQRVTHQPLGHAARAFEQAAHLHVDARAQPLDEEIPLDGALRHAVEQRAGDPPEGARGRCGLRLFDRADGLAHLQQAVAVVTQEAQQAAFELAARTAQCARAIQRRQRRGGGWCWRRAQRQIGEEQFRRRHHGCAAQRHQVAVERHQPHRLVAAPGYQFVQVGADRGDGAQRDSTGGAGVDEPATVPVGQRLFERVAEMGQAVETDDGQRAARLVQVGLGEFQCFGAAAVLTVTECLGGAHEGEVDLAADPDQRAQILFAGRGVHTLKPATEPLSSAARSASWPMDTAVCLVPTVVCSVMRRMPCMPCATRVACSA